MSVNYYNKDTGELVPVANGTLYADAPIGSIQAYGGTTAPSGWLLCQGQAVSRTTYAELFKAIGTAFGEGDGSTTFNLPDYRGKVPFGADANNVIGTDENGALPNIKGGITGMRAGTGGTANGCVQTTGSAENVSTWSGSYGGWNIDASRSSTLYKDGQTTVVPANVRVNYIIKVKHISVPVDFIDAMNEKYKASPYELNRSSNVTAFNRKWLVTGNSIVWTATHTGRLTIRCLKHGDGYSLYLTNQNSVMLDSYDNFFGDTEHGLTVSEASITLQGWVRKGDVIELSTNLPANTDWADKYFVQTGLLLYNDNFD